MSQRTLAVAIGPAEFRHDHPRLFDALQAAFPVHFVDAGPTSEPPAAFIGIGIAGAALAENLMATPCLLAETREGGQSSPRPARFGSDLPRMLRGSALSESYATPLQEPTSGVILATLDGMAAWVRDGDRHCIGCLPAELAAGEPLRDRLVPGRCLSLIALIHFLRLVTTDIAFTPPRLPRMPARTATTSAWR